jgi:mannose-6-phosphate isomerase-like protein (cupin superfamily)
MNGKAVRSSHQTYWVLGHSVRPLETLGDYAMLRISSNPGVPGPPPHHHEDAAELFMVLDGALEVMANGEWIRLGAGDTYCIPTRVVHTFRNPGETPCDWLTAYSPRNFERFFLDFGVPTEEADGAAKSVASEVIERVIADAANYGMVIAARQEEQ